MRHLVFAFALLTIMSLLTAPAFANSNIQMLPPTGYDNTPCQTGTTAGVLFWNGVDANGNGSPIHCAPGFVTDSSGDVTVNPLGSTTTAPTGSALNVNGNESLTGGVQVGAVAPSSGTNACLAAQNGTIAWMQLGSDTTSQVYVCDGSTWSPVGAVQGTWAGHVMRCSSGMNIPTFYANPVSPITCSGNVGNFGYSSCSCPSTWTLTSVGGASGGCVGYAESETDFACIKN